MIMPARSPHRIFPEAQPNLEKPANINDLILRFDEETRGMTTTSNAHEIKIGKTKKRKIQLKSCGKTLMNVFKAVLQMQIMPHPHRISPEAAPTRNPGNSAKLSLFGKLCDEVVLNILSYCDLDDIQSTRIWQSKKVHHFTETTCKEKAAEKNNLDNMKWIYKAIGDTDFYPCNYEDMTCSGRRIKKCLIKELTVL